MDVMNIKDAVNWIITGGVSILFFILWFWVKRYISQQDREQEAWAKAGGVVTREKFFEWCNQHQASCPACFGFRQMTDWRDGMFDKGGPLTKGEHTMMCKEIVKETMLNITEKLDQLFEHQREWVGQELRLLRTEISKDRRMDSGK